MMLTYTKFLVGGALLALLTNINTHNHIVYSIKYHDVKSDKNTKTQSETCLMQENILTPQCLDFHAKLISRAYPSRPLSTWFIPSGPKPGTNSITTNNDNGHQWQGLLLVKVPKASSSTLAGMILRIHNHTSCAVQWIHRMGREYANNRTSHSFLVSSIRDPTSRALSHVNFFFGGFYYEKKKKLPGPIAYKRRLMGDKNHGLALKKGRGGYQFNYLSPTPIGNSFVWTNEEPNNVQNPIAVHHHVSSLLQSYDFLMVTDRFVESLTIFSLLTDIPLHTVLVTATAKKSGYRLIRNPKKRSEYMTCKYSHTFTTPPEITKFLQSKTWLAMNYADELLHRAANHSLDLTIERLGQERFDKALREMNHLKATMEDYCGAKRLGNGCTANGTRIEPVEECYWHDDKTSDHDFGCGYQCMDEAVERMKSARV